MNKCVLLAIGSVLVGNAASEETNWLKIGDQTVDNTVIDGKTVGDKWIVVSNTLIRIRTEVTPLSEPSDASRERSTKSNSEPCLRLLLSTGDGTSEWGRVKGLHGLMYMAADFKTPALAKTSKVDICSSEDNARIVVMVADNGPIYSSTNSGMTWLMINTPGKHEFFLTGDAIGGGFKAAATIHPSPQNQPVAQSPTNWYAIGTASDGSGLVLNSSHGAPALRITRSSSGTIISWPSAFTGFVLQVNDDLSSTNWVDVPNPVKTVGQENQVFVPSPASNAFYRLRSLEN